MMVITNLTLTEMMMMMATGENECVLLYRNNAIFIYTFGIA